MNDQPVWKRESNEARRRLAGLVGRGAVGPEKSQPESPSTRSAPSSERPRDPFSKLPPELVEKIATTMVTDTMRETARDLGAVRRISPYINSVVEGSPQLTRVRGRIGELRSLTNEKFAAVVKDALPSVPSDRPGQPRESHPVSAVDHVEAVGPGLKLRSADENQELVAKIHAIPDAIAKSETISAMRPHFDDIPTNDRPLLMRELIKIFGNRGHPEKGFEAYGAKGYPINKWNRYEATGVALTQDFAPNRKPLPSSGSANVLKNRTVSLLSCHDARNGLVIAPDRGERSPSVRKTDGG